MRHDARVLSGLAATIALVVFLIDALTPLDVAIAVLYVTVVQLVASTDVERRESVSVVRGILSTTGARPSTREMRQLFKYLPPKELCHRSRLATTQSRSGCPRLMQGSRRIRT
jgi:hypothetical protein